MSAPEKRVAAVWREVLNISRVGLHDNFFDLGGHSLLAREIASGSEPGIRPGIRSGGALPANDCGDPGGASRLRIPSYPMPWDARRRVLRGR